MAKRCHTNRRPTADCDVMLCTCCAGDPDDNPAGDLQARVCALHPHLGTAQPGDVPTVQSLWPALRHIHLLGKEALAALSGAYRVALPTCTKHMAAHAICKCSQRFWSFQLCFWRLPTHNAESAGVGAGCAQGTQLCILQTVLFAQVRFVSGACRSCGSGCGCSRSSRRSWCCWTLTRCRR